ncbi:MAG TPA: cation:proton antiporter [Chryseosolibacter sp.]|nr:cation:proton antiporter [Chryseosolibacter sp.]
MGHLPALIQDLALILIAGAITTLIFRKIRQPLVLGYIIAGFLVGPHFRSLPTVADVENIETFAEIGVIFLLFSLGLEFSFKKLMRVGGEASITALFEIIFITVAGYYTGIWMGWSTMDSLFLGGMLASSSTTIIIRAFDELGVKTKQYASIVFGVLIVEDIVVILLMVLLSTIAVTQQFEGTEIIFTILKLVFFLALWFAAGIFLLPTLLRKSRELLDHETLLILSVGLCLGMVVVATQVGFSAELGAFIMGSIIAETTAAEKVEHVFQSVKDLFGAVFFVSVGMMIDPQAIIQYGIPVLIVTLLTLFGKLISTTIGALISGQSLRQSVQVGMSMAQIGEFAFIVATLGLSLGVISDFLFPVAVGASAITTFTTPYLIKSSDSVARFLERHLPAKWVSNLNRYSVGTQDIQAESAWKTVLKSYAKIGLTNGVILIALSYISVTAIRPAIQENVEGQLLQNIAGVVVTLAICAPFLWALIARRPLNLAYKELWLEKKYSRGPLLLIEITRVLLGVVFIGFLVFTFFSTRVATFVIVPVVLIVLVVFAKRIQGFYERIEGRFLLNLNARETAAGNTLNARVKKRTDAIQSKMLRWDAHIVEMEVNPRADFIGKTLAQLQWREKYGINIVYIKRGERLIHVPTRTAMLLPFDQVGFIATDDQLQAFKPVFDEPPNAEENKLDIEEIALRKVIVDEHTKLNGVDIRNSGIRERTNGLVIGVQRGDERVLNPDSTFKFKWGDIIWIVGERKRIKKLVDPEATVDGIDSDGKDLKG